MTYYFRCIIPNDRKLCHYYNNNDNNNNNYIDNDDNDDDDNDDDDDEYGERSLVKYQIDDDNISIITLHELGVLHKFTYINRLIFLQESHYRNCYLNSLSSDCCESDLDDIDVDGIDEILSKGSISKDMYIKYIDNILNFGLFVASDHDIKKGCILGEYVGLLVPFSSHDTPTGYGMNYPCGDDSYEINAYDYGNCYYHLYYY